MKKFVFIFAIASAMLAGCSESMIELPQSNVMPPPEPTKSYSFDRARASSIVESDSIEKNANTPADSIQININGIKSK